MNILITFGDIKLRFGKYKGKLLKEVPDSYLKWCLDNDVFKGKRMVYAKTKLNWPKDKYAVRVTDTLNNKDGEYIIEAYHDIQAMNICQRDNQIQNTQSFHGTCYSVTKIK